MNIGENVRSLRKEYRLTQPALAKQAKVSQSTISDLENGKKSVSAEILQQIAKALHTTIDQIMTGGGQNELDKKDLAQLHAPLLLEDSEIKYFEQILLDGGCGDISSILSKGFEKIRINKFMLQRNGIEQENCIAINVAGNSMSPKINNGDIAYVDISKTTPKDGKIFLIKQGDLFRLYRTYLLPNKGLRLVSDNKHDYPEERFTSEQIQAEDIEIVGWVWSWQASETW